MKSISKFIFRAIAFCLAASAAHAQTATLNINGRITNTPCTISVGAVNLGDVPIDEFSSSLVPATKYWKNFSVTLGGCELSTLNTASLKFNGNNTNSGSVLALKVESGMALGFGVRIMTNDTTHMPSGQEVVYVNNSKSYPLKVSSGKKSFDFQATYTALSTTASTRKPGTANATATITLTYS